MDMGYKPEIVAAVKHKAGGGTAEFPHVAIDTNHWKTFCHAGLATPAGERADRHGTVKCRAQGPEGPTRRPRPARW